MILSDYSSKSDGKITRPKKLSQVALKFLWLVTFWGGYRLGDLVWGTNAPEVQGKLERMDMFRSKQNKAIYIIMCFTKTQRDGRGLMKEMSGNDQASQGLLSVGQAWAEDQPPARVEGNNATHCWKEWAFQEKTTMWKDISERWAKSEQPAQGACRAKWSLILMGASHCASRSGADLSNDKVADGIWIQSHTAIVH